MHDLIIIGGGMSGIMVAHFFRPHKILLVEKATLLAGATGNHAGFMVAGFGEHYNRTVARWGTKRAEEIYALHQQSHAILMSLASDIGIAFTRSGSFSIPMNQKEAADLLQSHRLMNEQGHHTQWIDSVETGLVEPTGGLFNPDDGWIESSRLWLHLAQDIPARTECEVLEVVEEPSRVRLRTSNEDLFAERVVFCLNAFSANLVPELKGRYIPLRGQIIELPLQNSQPLESIVMMNYGDIYWRYSSTHLIFGGLEYLTPEEETGIAQRPSIAVRSAQLAWIEEHFLPTLLKFRDIRSRASTMAFTVDGFPFIGRLPGKRRYVLAGLCGLGHSYAPAGAQMLYELITADRDIIPSFCAGGRMEFLPVYQGGDWRSLYEAWNHGVH